MRRPWNIVDQPVYSLATYADAQFNMNICTYVTAVSMSPKMYVVAVYHNTKTLFNLQHTDTAVLQLLSTEQIKLVNILGKKSGNNYNKENYLHKKKLITTWQGYPVLQNAAAILLLNKKTVVPSGDHEMFLFDVVKYTTFRETNILTFKELINKGLIL
ncbi:MAG: flavin reductase [Chitinophagales bacterium]